MRIGLVAASLENTADEQVKQVENYLKDFPSLDMLLFGEQFLSGAYKISGNSAEDMEHALGVDSKEVLMLRNLANKHHCAIGFGFIEKDEEEVFNSYMIINERGEIIKSHRSVEFEPDVFDNETIHKHHTANTFSYKGLDFIVVNYADLEYIENIVSINQMKLDSIIWPAAITFNPTEWRNAGLNNLATQLEIVKPHIMMVNSFESEDNGVSGGAYLFTEGNVKKELPLGNKGILIINSQELRAD